MRTKEFFIKRGLKDPLYAISMKICKKKKILLKFLTLCLFSTGCSSYKIPIKTTDHPTNIHSATTCIKLSPLLDIPKKGKKNDP